MPPLGELTSIINQDNAPTDKPTGESEGGIFSVKVPSTLVSLVSVKLTKTNQHRAQNLSMKMLQLTHGPLFQSQWRVPHKGIRKDLEVGHGRIFADNTKEF